MGPGGVKAPLLPQSRRDAAPATVGRWTTRPFLSRPGGRRHAAQGPGTPVWGLAGVSEAAGGGSRERVSPRTITEAGGTCDGPVRRLAKARGPSGSTWGRARRSSPRLVGLAPFTSDATRSGGGSRPTACEPRASSPVETLSGVAQARPSASSGPSPGDSEAGPAPGGAPSPCRESRRCPTR
jgi:hypothetical protein